MAYFEIFRCLDKKGLKKVFLEISQNSQENICLRLSFLINIIKKETLIQVFSCEFWEISKNTFLYRIFPLAASVTTNKTQSDYYS